MEFQAVVLAAGHGSRMTDLTATMPKALLPIANMPLVWYPIQMLEKAGFKDVIVVVLESQQADICKALEICEVGLHVEFFSIPDDSDAGTADALRMLHPKIQHDLLVVSCDLVTDIQLHLVADVHRTHDATLTMVLCPQPDISEVSVPGGKANRKLERDFVGFDERGQRILFLASEADFEEEVSFKKSLFKKHPHLQMRSKLMDAHLYLMKKWVVDLLLHETSLSSIKGELVPHLVRKQFTHQSKKDITSSQADTSVMSPEASASTDPHSHPEEDPYSKLAQEMSSWNDHRGDMDDCYHGDKVRCYSYLMEGGFCLRANTLVTYCEANRQTPRQLSNLSSSYSLPLIHPSANIPQRPQIGADSMIGDGTTISEKVSIKRSVIGKHCTISEKAKITNSIIMNNVAIQTGCTISGCIICENAHISESGELKDCLVGASQTTVPMSKSTNEVLVDMDRMMEI